MPLSEDQRAMLRLLARREDGYEDIAALMGLSLEEVRARVSDALEALEEPGGTDPRPEAPSPKLEAAATSSTGRRRSASRPRPQASRLGLRGRLPANPRLRAGAIVGAIAVVLVAIVIATGALGGGGSSTNEATTTGDSSRAAATAPKGSQRVTGAVLTPVDGGDAIGQAILGRAGKEPILQVQAEGLEPSPPGETYTVWLYKSPKLVLRAGAVKQVDKRGGLAARFPIPLEVLEYIAGGVFDQIYLSLTPDAAYEAEVTAAKKAERLPAYTGTTVLRGRIEGPLLRAGR